MSRSPKNASFSSAKALISRSSRRARGSCSICSTIVARVWPYWAAMTFSFTVMFRNSRSDWNVRADPTLRDLVRREPDDARPVEEDVAAAGSRNPGDEVEDGRLPGAVRTDELTISFSLTWKSSPSTAVRPPKETVKSAELEQSATFWRSRYTTSTRCWPNRPAGRDVMRTMRITPSSSGRAVGA